MKSRLTAVILILAAAALMLLPINCAAAEDYPDLASHWAREYMLDLSERGFLTGYEDGTMRPDNLITSGEALALLSRLYAPDEDAAAMVMADYSAYLDGVVPESHAWAYDELAICLAAGVIGESELEALTLSRPITKELFCVLVARAAGLSLSEDAPESIKLNFADAGKITLGYLPYILAMTQNGIVTGTEKGEFEPSSSVSRAVAATVVSRALSLIGDEPLEIDGYSGCEKVYGFITGVSSSAVTVRFLDGIECQCIPGENCGINGTFNGRFAALNIIGSTVKRAVPIDGDWIFGTISSVHPSGKAFVTIVSDSAKDGKNYYANSDSVFNLNGEEVELSKLKYGSFAALCAGEGVIETLYCSTSARSVSGRISVIKYGATVDFRVIDGNGATWLLPLDMSKLPALKIGDIDITIDHLSVGDEVTAEISGGTVTSVTASVTSSTVTGTLTSIITDSRGTSWIVTKSNKDSCELLLAYNVKITRDGRSAAASSASIGDTVTATMYGGNVASIDIRGAETSETVSKLSGTVLAVDSAKKIITVLDSGRLYYINGSAAAAVVDAPTGKALRVTAIEAESYLTAYGSYDSSGTLKAVTIIIE